MAKILFWGDPDPGRHEEVGKLLWEKKKTLLKIPQDASYDRDQLQYLLTIVLILTVAEERIENLYQRNFAARCDKITAQYGLEQNDYWQDKEIPAEWKALDAEFEKDSFQVLLKTLKEYKLDDIAEGVTAAGSKQLYDMVGTLKAQFMTVLEHFASANPGASPVHSGAIPETLQS